LGKRKTREGKRNKKKRKKRAIEMKEGQSPRAWEKTVGTRGWMGAQNSLARSLLAQGRASIMACAVFSLVIEPTSSLHIDRIQGAERASALRTLPPSLHSSQLAPITLRLKGGEGNASPPTSHIIAMGTVCGSILVLNELDLLSVVVRVGLTFFLAVIFLLSVCANSWCLVLSFYMNPIINIQLHNFAKNVGVTHILSLTVIFYEFLRGSTRQRTPSTGPHTCF
jgi:hypothetical protein